MRIIPEFLPSDIEESKSSLPPLLVRNGQLVESKVQKPCTILVIDDDPSVQRLIQLTLAPGANVLHELDSKGEMVETLDFDEVDAIVLDYKLPGEDGLNLLKRIRKKYEALPVLFMDRFWRSGSGPSSNCQRCQ